MANFKTLKQFRNREGPFVRQYRVGEDVLVMFASKDQIYVRNLETDHWRLYHRGLSLKGTYKNWRLFRQTLRRRRKLNDQCIYNAAFKHNIDCMGVYKPPILDKSYKRLGE